MPRQYQQLKSVAVCQMCGCTMPRELATPSDGWLVSPLREDPSVDVIRCPAHISEWALRRSQAGRTKQWRQRMAAGKGWEPGFDTSLAPVPIRDVV